VTKLSFRRPLPAPITIPDVITLKTLGDVRKLLGHIPKERREIPAWLNVQKYLSGGDVENVSIAIQLALQIECVPYSVQKSSAGGTK
jgi:hypothetical protein